MRCGAVAERARNIPPSATVRIADAVAEKKRQGRSVVDFSAGRASEHTFEYLVRAATRAMQEGDTHQTMARGKPEFRKACSIKLARDNGLDADPDREIVATLGCKQGLFTALLATLDPDDEVLIEDPGFVSYEPAVRYAGGVARAVTISRERRFRDQERQIADSVNEKTKGIILCSPHNPTGIVHSPDDHRVIASLAQTQGLLVYSDETYERLTWEGRRHGSIAAVPGMRERTVTLMGLTKSFCMGGWRVGFAFAPKAIVDAMLTVQEHLVTCVSSFAQTAGALAYGGEPPDEVRSLWSDWERRTRTVTTALDAFPGVRCTMPEGAFYAWADIRERASSSKAFADHLLEDHGVAVVPGSAFGPSGEGYVRITCARSWREIDLGLERLSKALC